MPQDAVELLAQTLRIYSPTEKEGRLASFLAERMNSLGFRNVRGDSAGNVFGEAGKGRKRLLLCGHMDTVPGELPVSVGPEVVTGRGAADAKSPLCAMLLAAARRLDSSDLSVTFAGVTREEGDGLGISTIIRSGERFDWAVFGEPSGASRVTVGYRGRMRLTATSVTDGGHASSPWVHPSAIDASFELSRLLRTFEEARASKDDHYRSLSVCMTIINAGTYENVIPARSVATFDIRIPPGTRAGDVEAEITRLVAKEMKAQVSLEFGEATEPYEADLSGPLVRAFQRAIIISAKKRPVMVRKTGTGDMNTLASATGTPCVTYGPGDSNLGHTDRECVEVADYLSSIDVLSEALTQISLLGGGRKGA